MDNLGQIFSARKIAAYLKNQGLKVGVESVYSYIQALENALTLYPAKKYDIIGKKILDRKKKYFLAYLGLRNSIMGYCQNDISQLLENVVFLALKRKDCQIFVGKEGMNEIDVIAEKQCRKLYAQVAYLLASNDVIKRESSPLAEVHENYRKLVISVDRISVGEREGIEWMNIIDFIRTADKNSGN